MLSTALQVEFAVLRESLRYPNGRTRSSADGSRGPARSLEVGPGAPARHDIRAKKIRLRGIVRTMGAALAMTCGWPGSATAEKIEAALARAYQNNPQLNAQRATVRQTDGRSSGTLRLSADCQRECQHRHTTFNQEGDFLFLQIE
jgi:hypothetical protein